MTETKDIRLRRLYMRATHRGIKEMDLLLGAWADDAMPKASNAVLDQFEGLLEEPDQDLYLWVSGQTPAPAEYAALIADIGAVFANRNKLR